MVEIFINTGELRTGFKNVMQNLMDCNYPKRGIYKLNEAQNILWHTV